MIMREDEYFGPGLIYYVEGAALVGMRRPRLVRRHALCGPCVSRTGRAPSACGRRNRAELHIQDMQPRMLPPSAAPRRGACCTHPCCSFPSLALFVHMVPSIAPVAKSTLVSVLCKTPRFARCLHKKRTAGEDGEIGRSRRVEMRSGIATAPQKGKPLCWLLF